MIARGMTAPAVVEDVWSLFFRFSHGEKCNAAAIRCYNSRFKLDRYHHPAVVSGSVRFHELHQDPSFIRSL